MVRRSTRKNAGKPPKKLGNTPPKRRSRSKSPKSKRSPKRGSPKSVGKSVRKAGRKVRAAAQRAHKKAAGVAHKVTSKVLPDKYLNKAAVLLPLAISASAVVENVGVLGGTAVGNVLTTSNCLQFYAVVFGAILFKDYVERRK